MVYRYDIDGLRAIAVLAVVLFHIDPNWVPGGFIGVDIFFVISGFLITSIIQRQMQTGKFSFREFYRRRILRILPAATLVITTTLLVGQFVMLPDDLNELAKSAAAAQLWSANIYFTFFLDTGYFADAAILQPLLHLWSLGIEEQFYLFWPVALLFGMRWQRQNLFWVLVIVTMIASFILGQLIAAEHTEFAYYMLPSRAGQLLAGALIAAAIARGLKPAPLIANISSLFGAILIGWSLFALSGDMIYPGINAVPPTIGAALMLYGGAGRGNFVSVPLMLPPVRYIGLISYSLYLWHWPIMSFYWYAFGEPYLTAKLTLFGMMLLLSIMSYYLVENPFRHLRVNASAAFLRIAAIPALCIIALSSMLLTTDGYGIYALSPVYKTELTRLAADSRPAFSAQYVCQSYLVTDKMLTNPDCIINGDIPDALLWGDSNAAHYVGVLSQAAEELGFSFRNIAHSSCPPVLDIPEHFVRDTVKERCRESGERVRTILTKYHTIIIAAQWDAYLNKPDFNTAMSSTLTKLIMGGHQVFVIGIIPRLGKYDRNCSLKRLKLPSLHCEAQTTIRQDITTATNEKIRALTEETGGTFLSFNQGTCTKGRCSPFMDGEGLYYDTSHWSVFGSLKIGSALRKAGLFPQELRRVPAFSSTLAPATASQNTH
ncbi:acyltransferase [Falsochrobactrum shanghaiense]|uniref:Acyltransferase n=1 Tax=Falsochrobactrum shanghaiense TaxID=2201899 RepID=A0A316J726_9HYPH|nr:acyltransferase family protein [Falsochrobactrum shanghaiense]PWL17667.1 acyltransferase [Falsochrobactrum shanghaiense]